MNKHPSYKDVDPTAEERKKDHIELAFQSQVAQHQLDNRFHYEPILAAHPTAGSLPPQSFLGKTLKVPIWVSSMTGGTALALTINHNLARACQDFGMGMGLGSCRALLFSDERLSDFDVRHLMGDDLPLFANLGIAQIEQLLDTNELWRIDALLDKLRADGLIIHVNPLQEWLQPEGDHIKYPPLQTIERLLQARAIKLIVKEVGQGMGYGSLKALLQLPIEAVDFAASGGTNFAKLELLRSDIAKQGIYEQIALIGHSAAEMVDMTNHIVQTLGDKVLCHNHYSGGT
ncbi:MAG: isopentenyl-diphosphate delta-isomerase, partial [Saprospiraceae bacterium]|nr:isopentenyl-diphosphate delta-isomerase [Saprospiraceae bacterium]